METTWIEVGGFAIGAPTNAGTNLVLALLCARYWVGLRGSGSPRRRLWGGFFLMMAVATFAGVFKHGARHLMAPGVLVAVLATSSVASALAVHCAQRAAIVSHTPRARQVGLELLVEVQLAVFIAANVVLGPRIELLIANTAAGLVPVIVVEARQRRRVAGAGVVSLGLLVSILTGLVYVVELSPSRWFNHIDVAHALMGVSFLTVRSGLARSEGHPWT